MQRITKAAVICAALCYLTFPTVAQPTRDFSYEFSCSEYQRLRKECEGRIDALENASQYMNAAIVCRKLLSDFNKESEVLTKEQTRLEQKDTFRNNNAWKMNMFAKQMATCYAHLGDFAPAKRWAKKTNSEYWQRVTAEEIGKCEKLLPILASRIKDYRLKPSASALREFIEIYLELDEYAFALAFMNLMMEEYPEYDWTQSEDFRGCHGFLKAFRDKPLKEVEEQKAMPAALPKVEALFDKLWALEEEKREFALRKWDEMDVIDKAKFVNRHRSQQPQKGWDFNPTKEEAIEFLKGMEINPNVPRYLPFYHRLPKEYRRIYEQRRDNITSELAALGEEAVDDLILRLQDIRPRKQFSRWLQPGWAVEALSQIGAPAIPKLEMAFDKASQPKGHLRHSKSASVQFIVKALAKMRDTKTIPVLRRALNEADGRARELALDGLAQLKGGLTTAILLNLC